jgi:DNA-binding SARP family transcriptional activator
MLLGAYARSRTGDPEAGALAASAFDLAGQYGVEHFPMLHEPEVTAAMAGLAAAAGSPVASRVAAATKVTTVRLLGRFDVARSGLPLPLPAGQPAQVVKLLATLGGRAHVEVVIDALWPDADPVAGRKLVRNVLTRLRRGLGAGHPDLVVRDEDTLAFPADVDVDAVRFDADVDRALSVAGIDDIAAAAIARVAVARYGGDLLPDDRYEDWAAIPRERLRHRLVVMVRLLADVAERAGRTDEAVRYLERAIAAEPLDGDHYLHLSRVLAAAGRDAAAEQAVIRGARATAELGA